MLSIYAKYPKAFLTAIVMHVVLALFLFLNINWTTDVPDVQPEVNVVKATAIDEAQVQAEIKKIKQDEARRKKKEEDRVKKLERDADKAQRKREDEQKRIAELEKKRKQELQAKKKAEEERKQLEEQRNKAEAERQLAEEQARKAKEEAQRALEVKRRLEEQETRERMLAEEAQRLASEDARKKAKAILSHTALIKEKVEAKWGIPPSATKGMSCVVRVRIIPSSGQVLSAEIEKTSGNAIFDRSVTNAVHKASPLPMPGDPGLRSEFRNFILTFTRKE